MWTRRNTPKDLLGALLYGEKNTRSFADILGRVKPS